MNLEQLFSAALGIADPWYIKSVNFDSSRKKLDIEVDFRKGSTFQDDSSNTDSNTDSKESKSQKEYKAYDTIRKTWRHLNFFEHECYLHCRTPRIQTDMGTTKLILSLIHI